MLGREIVEKFKNLFKHDVKTIKDWEQTAQKAMKEQSFPVQEGIDSLDKARAFDAQNGPERTIGRDMHNDYRPNQYSPRPVAPAPIAYKPVADSQRRSSEGQTLAELMRQLSKTQQH